MIARVALSGRAAPSLWHPPAARRTREVRGGELCGPSCARAVGARRHHHTAFGYAYRTTALGAQRVHGKGLEVKTPASTGRCCEWLRLQD